MAAVLHDGRQMLSSVVLAHAFVIVSAVLQAQGSAPRHPVELSLDVMGIAEPADVTPESGGCGCVAVTTDSGPATRPAVKVSLVQVSPEAFTIGDPIVFELLLEHVGDAPVSFAITRDPKLAPSCRMGPAAVRTSFALIAEGGSHTIIAVGPALYGSRDAAATTMTLQPGERLRVRVPATATSLDASRPITEGSQHLRVQGVVMIASSPCQLLYERSGESVPVSIARPR